MLPERRKVVMGWNNYFGVIGSQMPLDIFYADKDDYEPRKPQRKITVNGRRVCPECGKELKVRTNKKNGTQFLACQGYWDTPRCFFTEKIH